MTSAESNPITAAKMAAGKAAAGFVQNGMLVGLGTGSTAYFFIEALAQRCREGLQISAVATSQRSSQQAQLAGIPLEDPDTITSLDLTVDGADEIDPNKNMIKGGGGALLREKLLACSSREMIVIVDETKLVNHLGAFPVPVEIAHFAYRTTLTRLQSKGYEGKLRVTTDHAIYTTDNGNHIFDIQFRTPITQPIQEHESLRDITGVLETGLFFNVAKRVIVGHRDGSVNIQM